MRRGKVVPGVRNFMMVNDWKSYDFRNPVDLVAVEDDEPLFAAISSTAAFRRLADIRFLGGIDYLLVRTPNGAPGHRRYTRYQHSLGVARLAYLYGIIRDLSPAKRRLAYAAALLHDIGHAPLSHTLEGVFQKNFRINHHLAGVEIVTGRSPFGEEISAILKQFGLDAEQVMSVAAGKDDEFEGFFGGPINFDTIEGILRSWIYLRPKAPSLSPEEVMVAAMRRDSHSDRETVDRFWEYKDNVYRYIIRSEFGVAADRICELAAEASISNLSRNDYFLTERQLFKKIPDLRHFLLNFHTNDSLGEGVGSGLQYQLRTFGVDTCHDFFARDDVGRYKQWKEDRVMRAPELRPAVLCRPKFPDFFDDLSIRTNKIAIQ